MAIITISREIAAMGDEIAHELARLMGYRFVDKKTLEDRITAYGFNGQKFEKYDEKKPGFWSSLSRDRDDYLHFLKTAVLEETQSGGCIFVGRGVNVIFKDIPGVLSIRLVAPLPIRIERVKSYFHCDEKRARQIIERSDKDRAAFHKYFFDLDWNSPVNYHLIINTGILHPETAAALILNLKEKIINPEIEALCATKLKELTLGQRVIHNVLYTLSIPIHFMEVSICDGVVVIRGVANSHAAVEAAIAGAQQVVGDMKVQSELQVIQEYSVMP